MSTDSKNESNELDDASLSAEDKELALCRRSLGVIRKDSDATPDTILPNGYTLGEYAMKYVLGTHKKRHS